MIWEIGKKRILLNFLNLRFPIITLVLVSLILFSLLTSINTFNKRMALYQEDISAHKSEADPSKVFFYSTVRVGFDKPPERLSVLAKGIGEEYGSSAIIRGKYGPIIIRSREKSNIFLAHSPFFDFVHILGLIISLMAILITYDTISGEKEDGTLQLALSNSIGKYKILIGEYIGAMLSLLIPLLVSFLTAAIILQFEQNIGLDMEMLVGVCLLFLNSIFLASIFVLIGIISSSLVGHSTLALMLSFFMWILLIILYPGLASWVSRYGKPVESLVEITSTDVITQKSPENFLEAKSTVDEKTKELNLNKRLVQSEFENRIKAFSPFSSYLLTSQIIAGTDVGAHKNYISQAKHFEQVLRKWQDEKIRKYPKREYTYTWNWGPLDLEDIPLGEYKDESIEKRLERVFPYTVWIFCLNIILFSAGYVTFIRYDPRFK